jgi:hypothetical protein
VHGDHIGICYCQLGGGSGPFTDLATTLNNWMVLPQGYASIAIHFLQHPVWNPFQQKSLSRRQAEMTKTQFEHLE